MSSVGHDARYALRSLIRRPGFAFVVIATLALGIGANSAIFSVVHAVLLRPLPFAEPDRLLMVYTGYPEDETRYPLSPPDFMSIHDDATSFEGVAATSVGTATLTGRGDPEQIQVANVSRGFFDVVGVTPVLGRAFLPEENVPGGAGVAMLGHALWQQQFGSDPAVLGQMLELNGEARTIVGILPPEFDLPAGRQLYLPLPYDERFSSSTDVGRRSEFLMTIARLAPGVSATDAAVEVRQISERLQQVFPQTNSENINLTITPLTEELIGDVRLPLLVLLGAVGMVLLISCVNVANLLLARGAARREEMAIRSAIGADAARLARQLLTESLLLGLTGGAVGLLFALGAVRALAAAGPEGIPRLELIEINAPVIAFTFGLSVLTALLFGLVPALDAARAGLSTRLRQGGRGGGAGGAQRVRRTLVVAEVAFAVILLVGSALLLRSFLRLVDVEPGFQAENLLAFQVSLPESAYADGSAVRGFYGGLLERLEGVPGITSVGAVGDLPLTGISNYLGFQIENREPRPPGMVVDAAVSPVAPGYFSTLGIPLLAGRDIDERDAANAPLVIVVNEAFVRRYFPGEDPLGHRLSFDGEEWVQIVGVVGDVPQYGLESAVRPAIFAPYPQFTTRSLAITARTAGDPAALFASIRQEVAAIDPDLPLQRLRTGEELLSSAVAQPRFYTTLLATFGVLALALSAIGIFGVISFLVAQRTREIGVRLALGADGGRVARMVVGGTLVLTGVGVLAGLFAAVIGARILSGMLYEIDPFDPIAYLAGGSLLLAVGVLAGYLPARSAMRIDPNVALRFD